MPHGTALAERVGLQAELTSPATGSALVWHDGLHRIPDGLLLGVPGDLVSLARSRLLSVRGKVRAAIEPLLPTVDHGDSVGTLIRARFGDEVHERLVDALVGSIYAADTDRFSLAMVPQLASLAAGQRSLLLAARRARRAAPPVSGPIFQAPTVGHGGAGDGGRGGAPNGRGPSSDGWRQLTSLALDGAGWRVDDDPADAVVLATPAVDSARLVAPSNPPLASLLGHTERASVAIVTLAVPNLPASVRGMSGYLVPKPAQRLVTAASFGSQKWAHWRGPDEIVRVSFGRDGLPIDDLDDATLVDAAVARARRAPRRRHASRPRCG